ncbi:hypothetical protein Tco_0866901 [Tanacetum coccineum]
MVSKKDLLPQLHESARGRLPKELVSHSCSLAGSTSAMEVSIPIAFVLPDREHECNESFKLANSHVTPDLEAMDNSEAYYGDDALHVSNATSATIVGVAAAHAKLLAIQEDKEVERLVPTVIRHRFEQITIASIEHVVNDMAAVPCFRP